MPHSSGGGGGSFGGGFSSRSGGSHSGSSSTVRTPVMSSRPRPGLKHRYVYYRGYRPYYIYSDMGINKSDYDSSRPDFVLSLIGFILCFIIGGVLLLATYRFEPSKINISSYNHTIQISDTIDVIDDNKLYDSFVAFQNETGITPAFLSISDERCLDSDYLEDYAYDTYVQNWGDENHWLIVYNQVDQLNKWEFIGMQGDNTDDILDDYVLDVFNDEVVDSIKDRKDVTKAFVNAFDHATDRAMDHGVISKIGHNIGLGLMGIGAAILAYFIKICRRNKKEKLYIIPESSQDGITEFCPVCHGEFVKGMHSACPYCGAELQQNTEYENQTLNG